VILSFENHCNPKQQAKIAQYCREFFGEMMLDTPLENHPVSSLSTSPEIGPVNHKKIPVPFLTSFKDNKKKRYASRLGNLLVKSLCVDDFYILLLSYFRSLVFVSWWRVGIEKREGLYDQYSGAARSGTE